MALVVTENGAYDAVNSNTGTAGLTITVLTAALWPDPAVVGPYSFSTCPSGVPYTNDTGERGVVTGKSGAVLTVVRAQEGTTAKNIAIGWQLFKGAGAQDLRGALSVADRNLLRNPGFWLFQRGTSALSVGDGVYGPDGWYSLVQTAAQTSSRVNPTNSPTKSPYGGVWTQSQAVAQRHGCAQIVPYERTYPLRGEPIRFEFMISAAPFTGNIRYAILEWPSTADVVTKDVVLSWTSTNYTAGNFFTVANNVLATGVITPGGTPTLASIRATVGSTANNLIVVVWTESTQAVNNLFVISDAWLVPDTLSAPFTPRPAAEELANCQRFFQKSYNIDTAPGAASNNTGIRSMNIQATEASNSVILGAPYQTRMRAAATIVIYDFAGNSGKLTEISSNASVVTSNIAPSTGVVQSGENGFAVQHDPAGNIGGLMYHFTADAELGV